MKPKVIFFTILFSLFISLSPSKEPRATELNSKTLIEEYANKKCSFSGELKFQRVFKNGKWWIYVYDGTKLVDIYPE